MRIPSLAGVVILGFTLLARIVSAQAPAGDGSADLEAARRATQQHPGSYEAWSQRLAIESMWAAMHSVSSAETERREAGERRFRELLAEWKAARPHDGGPFLIEIYREPDSASRQARVLALAERFPDDPVVLQHSMRVLTDQGELAMAARALESFAEAHPGIARGFELLVAHYESNGNRPAAHEVAEEWMARFPEDAGALAGWLRTSGQGLSPAAAEGVVARTLPILLEKPLTAETLQLCQVLSQRPEAGIATSGWRCVEQIAERGDSPGARGGAARILLAHTAESGDWEGALANLDGLPPDDRFGAAWNLASHLRAPQDCPRIVALFGRLATVRSETRDVPTEIAGGLQRCSDDFAARELYVGLFATTRAERLSQLLYAWRATINGRLMLDLPLDRLLPVLRRRWAEAEGDPGIAEALDLVYEAAGLREERLALMRSEGAQGRWPRNALRLIELAEEETAAGDSDVAVELLGGALLRAPDDVRVYRAFAELLLVLDRKREAQTLAERGLASDSEWIRGAAHLTLARLAVRNAQLEAALVHYRAAIESAGAVRELADELFFVLALGDRESQIPAIAEELCAGRGLRESGQSAEACVAAALTRSGQAPESAMYLQGALAKAPHQPEVLTDLARSLEAAGDRSGAERVLRQRIAIDPKEEGGWAELGLVLSRAKDVSAHARLLDEAERSLGAPSMLLRYQRAELQLSTGEARGAIETLLAMKKLRPELDYYDDLLRQAYARLGAQQ